MGRETYVALDVGPTGKLLKPMGDLSFEEAYETFAEVVRYGVKYGADFIHIETMSDTYEVKAAVLAAKEHSELPVFVTMIFDEKGKLLTTSDWNHGINSFNTCLKRSIYRLTGNYTRSDTFNLTVLICLDRSLSIDWLS